MRGIFIRRLTRDCNGNVAMIFALSIIPIIFMTGMALDFANATHKRAQFNAAADAAALAAVTTAMMAQPDAAALTAATNTFSALASTITGVTSVTPTVNIVDGNNGFALTRTVTVNYTANVTNNFPNVLKLQTGTSQPSWPISGSSQSTSNIPPNINFYLLLDNSPSMNIAATSAGIATMVANTSAQGGCAFACHESNPSADNLGNPHGEDNYTLAQNLGVTTRIENMAAATQALMTTASTMEVSNNATYKMAIYTFNHAGTNTIQTLTSNLNLAQTAASTIDVLEVYDNNCLTSSNCNNDTDTDFNTAMSNMDSVMPNPGTGSASSTPQEVLFIVSDGVDDKISVSCSETLDGNRCQQPFDTTWCTTEKSRGIRIAVLYTEYLPLPTNSWYNSWVSAWQPNIATNLQNCASAGLYFKITTDGDISGALQTLFKLAVGTARLSQ